jgi:hypothetical protein
MCWKVLDFLAKAKAQGWPFVTLEGVHKRTINALFEYDLIDICSTADGTRYKITDRGERTRKVYETPTRRSDGMCPVCGIRPRHVLKNGKVYGYCVECERDHKRKTYQLRRPRINPDRMCSHCGKRKVHVSQNGRAITYCLHCKNVKNRSEKRKKRRREVKLAQRGIIKTCIVKGCTNPRHVTATCVQDYCTEHYTAYHTAYRARRKAARFQQVVQR